MRVPRLAKAITGLAATAALAWAPAAHAQAVLTDTSVILRPFASPPAEKARYRGILPKPSPDWVFHPEIAGSSDNAVFSVDADQNCLPQASIFTGIIVTTSGGSAKLRHLARIAVTSDPTAKVISARKTRLRYQYAKGKTRRVPAYEIRYSRGSTVPGYGAEILGQLDRHRNSKGLIRLGNFSILSSAVTANAGCEQAAQAVTAPLADALFRGAVIARQR